MPLHPLPINKSDIELGSDNPIVVCENCGAQDKTHNMYGFLISLGVAGHPLIGGFTCGATQGEKAHNHWSCPNERCFVNVLTACAREHLHPMAQSKREVFNVSDTNKV